MAPSTLAGVGRYVLTPRIFHHLALLCKGAGGEIQLTDGIAALMQEEQVLALASSASLLRARDVAAHRRHALRAYLLVNGVWFLRIGIMLTGLVLAPLGIQIDYSGAPFILVSFGSWMVPMAVLALSSWAAKQGSGLAVDELTGQLTGIGRRAGDGR